MFTYPPNHEVGTDKLSGLLFRPLKGRSWGVAENRILFVSDVPKLLKVLVVLPLATKS